MFKKIILILVLLFSFTGINSAYAQDGVDVFIELESMFSEVVENDIKVKSSIYYKKDFEVGLKSMIDGVYSTIIPTTYAKEESVFSSLGDIFSSFEETEPAASPDSMLLENGVSEMINSAINGEESDSGLEQSADNVITDNGFEKGVAELLNGNIELPKSSDNLLPGQTQDGPEGSVFNSETRTTIAKQETKITEQEGIISTYNDIINNNSSTDTEIAAASRAIANAQNTIISNGGTVSSSDINANNEIYDNTDVAKSDIRSKSFEINVSDISPGMPTHKGTTKENVNFLLATIIQNLMIVLGSLALLIMTIGAGYIVLHLGQDELLSKGKTIFMSGVYSLVVALSAYYLVAIIRFMLYST